MVDTTSRLEKVEYLQNMLLAQATGGQANGEEYQRLRRDLVGDEEIRELLPRFVITKRNLSQFWNFIKHKFSTYQERREYIWEQFRFLIDRLEGIETGSVAPHDRSVSEVISDFGTEHVHQVWQKALDRQYDDPEAALTSARTLLESVCKHILDEADEKYSSKDDLPKLYGKTTTLLNMAPAQHQEEIFKQILGGCHSVVQGLGAIRNKLSDAHGKGVHAPRPRPRHAALGVDLAGAMAEFLVSSWLNQQQ